MQVCCAALGPAARRGGFRNGRREVDTGRIVCYTVDIIKQQRGTYDTHI